MNVMTECSEPRLRAFTFPWQYIKSGLVVVRGRFRDRISAGRKEAEEAEAAIERRQLIKDEKKAKRVKKSGRTEQDGRRQVL